ncbi:DUF1573 domain-containing protein [Flavobacterium enshiense]|uniref:DUF1573 domain-containing protein n=1 Tax=Flavobacterium enshiense TaxID=1341165 RepID=UPI00345D4F19
MKKILLLGAFFILNTVAVEAQEIATKAKTEIKAAKKAKKAKKVKMPKVEGVGMFFESETIDYGTIDQDANGQREFVFTNNGDKPLIIMNAQGSCGCTVPTFPKEPIAPGAKGVIGVKYDTHRTGNFNKQVTLTTNASETPKVLTIKGEVKAAPVKAEPAKPQEIKS